MPMTKIMQLNRNDRIVIWQSDNELIDDEQRATVIQRVFRAGEEDKVIVQLDGTAVTTFLTDSDYFDKLPISFKKAEHFEDYKNIPKHYSGQTDVIEFTRQQFTKDEWIASMKFNIIKYATRLGRKDALDKELDKIIDYAQRLKEGL